LGIFSLEFLILHSTLATGISIRDSKFQEPLWDPKIPSGRKIILFLVRHNITNDIRNEYSEALAVVVDERTKERHEKLLTLTIVQYQIAKLFWICHYLA